MISQMKFEKVVLVGASGNLGAIVLQALHATNLFDITVLTRSAPTTNPSKFPPNVKVITTDYSPSELVEIFRGQDVVISTVGATGFADQKAVIDAAVEAGVKRYLPSELSTNTLSENVRELVPVFETKLEVLEYLRGKEGMGLTWTGLAAGPLLDWGLKTGFLGFDIAAQNATIWDDGNTRFSASNEADLGKAVISILQHPAETANRYLYTHSLATTQNELLQAFEKASGKKWSTQYVRTDEQIALGREKVSQGDFTGMYELVRASAWGKIAGIRANYEADEDLANTMLDLPTADLDETVLRVLKE